MKLRLIASPPILKKSWEKSRTPRFPGGRFFVAEILENRVLVWGGDQKQEDGSWRDLPSDVVYSFQPPKDGKSEGVWTVMAATGNIHPVSWGCASTVNAGILYISRCDALSTLSASGFFTRLQPTGDIPSTRIRHRGFSHAEKVHWIGGFDDRRNYFNELHQYDPESNSITLLKTTGASFTPQSDFAIAVVGDRAFIHGGGNKRFPRSRLDQSRIHPNPRIRISTRHVQSYSLANFRH